MEETPPSLRASGRRFMSWGRSNAQLLGVGFVLGGAIYYVGGAIRELQTQRELYETKLEKQEEKVARARAEAFQQCNEKFLLYGYAAEYQAFQQKALGKKIPSTVDKE